jgi:hypothetical protein
MVQLTFMLGDQDRISADELSERNPPDPVERIMLLAIRNRIRRRLGRVFCLRHGESPRVIASGPSADQLTFSVQGCCRDLVDDATRVLPSSLTAEGSIDMPLAC